MARDTRTDAPTAMNECACYTCWSKRNSDPEKIEAEKSDVQPMVVDENEFGEKILFGKGKGQLKNPYRENLVNEFDEGIKGLTERRGDVYGHPKDDFDRIIQMQKALGDCDDEFARHIMNMICVKMSRLVKTPDHSDSWLDIVGYVRTWFMIKEKKDG